VPERTGDDPGGRAPVNLNVECGDETPNLGIRICCPEAIRTVHFEATIAFLQRGGHPEKIRPSNVDHFYTILPWKETTRFSFPSLGIRGIDPEQILDLLSRDPKAGESDDPSWIQSILN
jgi:hypothetical protein